jgi:predicted metal-dependent HD superfamily phosphohydrolase
MGAYDAPQWLLPAFVRSVQAAGGTVQPEEIRSAGESLIEHWSAPDRRLHNLKHLVSVLARVDELTEETHEPDLVRLAAWYHGVVFDAALKTALAAHGGEDEVASADLAYRELVALGVPEARARRVHDLVVHLARHTPDPADPDSGVLSDADLGMLAVEPQRYKAYLADLRAEYAHVPIPVFLAARRRILRKLLARTSLFVTPMSEGWEEPARQNLTAELARVDKELAKVEAGGQASDEPGTGGPSTPGTGPAGAGTDGGGAPGAATGTPATGTPSAGTPAPGPTTSTGPTVITRITAPTKPIVAVIPRSIVRTPASHR